MGKPNVPPQPRYRDDPDNASTSSAVLLEDIDYPDEDLPSYEDTPSAALLPPSAGPPSTNAVDPNGKPPALPFSTHDFDCSEIRTTFPDYSTHEGRLHQMIREQAVFPPGYHVRVWGTHQETNHHGNKKTKTRVDDFFFEINLTPLFVKNGQAAGEMELLPDNIRGYRGGVIKRLSPSISNPDIETQHDELRAWCENYVSNPSKIKSFALKREIINHDTKKLEALLRSLIASTNYRGHVGIQFPTTHKTVIVYSPGLINQWRITQWLRYIFYYSLLFIFSWPVLIFLTARYEVLKVKYAYANISPEESGDRIPTVMSEQAFFNLWETAIRTAVMGKYVNKDQCLDTAYRCQAEQQERRRMELARNPQLANTGNAFVDGSIGVLGAGLALARAYNSTQGWGGDC